MNNDKNYYIHKVYRHLELALIGIRQKNREHIEAAIEMLEIYEQELKKCNDR